MRNKFWMLLIVSGFLVLLPSCGQDVKQTADELYKRARFYEYQGNDNIAVEKMEQAVAKDPENKEMLYRLASLYSRKGMYKKAEEAYGKIIEIDSGEYRAVVCLGNLAYYQERYREAVAYWKKAVEINPELKKDRQPYFTNVGMNVIQQPYTVVENEKWREDSGVARVDSSSARMYGVMGKFSYDRGLYDAAIKDWQKVIQLSPGSYEAQQAELNIKEAEKKLNKHKGEDK
ncbi:MAG: tetratricopeptide repeat protein [Candidatus Wallbacteria bacterium]|nr:tetratricopeptide repeat protein [Candidatus Wallbacteria bacterium]